MRRKEVAAYLGPGFRYALRVWSRTKRYGLPNGSGWANEPAATMELLDLFEDELEAWKDWRKPAPRDVAPAPDNHTRPDERRTR